MEVNLNQKLKHFEHFYYFSLEKGWLRNNNSTFWFVCLYKKATKHCKCEKVYKRNQRQTEKYILNNSKGNCSETDYACLSCFTFACFFEEQPYLS